MPALQPRLATGAEGHAFGLDLARFLAIALVLVTHCSMMFLGIAGQTPPAVVLMASFFGVELFFVLSGFLIGGLLFRLAETDPTPRGWLIFMARRWMRTLPLYLVWLVVLVLVLPGPADRAGMLLRYAAMLQNFAWPMPPAHWFNESWSLTVEEWFYSLFSIALLGSAAIARSDKVAWPVLAAFIVVPPVLRAFAPAHGDFDDQIYHVALFRLDAIAWGAALARLHRQGSALFAHPRLCGTIGAVLVAIVWSQGSNSTWLPMPWTTFLHARLLAASIGLSLLLVALLPLHTPRGALRAVVRGGARISYGIYIMHLTIIATVAWQAAQHGLGLGVVVPVSLALIVLLPALSWRFFEAPILAHRPRQSPARAAWPARGLRRT